LGKQIHDIIVFGSFVKGGFANDVDIAVLVNEKNDFGAIKKKIKESISEETDLQIIDIDSIYSPLWLTLIKEGFSIKKNMFLYELYKIKPMVLYKYSLKKLTNVQKVQFERGLKKTVGKQGVVLTRSVILVPLFLKNEMKSFFERWDIYYETQEYELVPLLRKESFL